MSKKLVKARLTSKEASPIEFMFNPTEISIEQAVKTSEEPGATSTESGKPKVVFSSIQSKIITINKILFDTYEQRKDVVQTYINPFFEAIKFVPNKERTPIYTFSWGSQIYLRRCFIEKLNYKLLMFLENGTPVRAVIENLTLKEADEPSPSKSNQAKSPSSDQRNKDSIENRKKKK